MNRRRNKSFQASKQERSSKVRAIRDVQSRDIQTSQKCKGLGKSADSSSKSLPNKRNMEQLQYRSEEFEKMQQGNGNGYGFSAR